MKSASKHDNRAAGDVMPQFPKVNSLQALMRLRPITGSQWCVLAFSLNRDMIQADGTLDDLHGVVFPLGSFDDKEKAEKHANNVIELTGHPAVIVVKYGYPLQLTTKFNPAAVVEVHVDAKGKIMKLESDQYKREKELHEKRVKLERDIMKEAEEETDPDTIEHFKRQCYLAIKNRANFQIHRKEADSAWENYKKREMSVRDHYARHPDHEEQWLPYLKDKLIERGEENLFIAMEAAYHEIRDEILGLTESSDEETNVVDNIPCECPNGICEGSSSRCEDGVCSVTSSPKDECTVISSDECEDGVCSVTSSPKDECMVTSSPVNDVISSLDDEDDIISEEEVLPEVIEKVEEDIISNANDDDIIDSKEDDIIDSKDDELIAEEAPSKPKRFSKPKKGGKKPKRRPRR